MSGELSCSCKLSGLKRESWGQYFVCPNVMRYQKQGCQSY